MLLGWAIVSGVRRRDGATTGPGHGHSPGYLGFTGLATSIELQDKGGTGRQPKRAAIADLAGVRPYSALNSSSGTSRWSMAAAAAPAPAALLIIMLPARVSREVVG